MNSQSGSAAPLTLRPVIQLPIDMDLTQLASHWRRHKLIFRVVEQAGGQVIYAQDETSARIIDDLKRYESGESLEELTTSTSKTSDAIGQDMFAPDQRSLMERFLSQFSFVPVTLTLFVLSCIGFLAGTYQIQPLFDLMLMQTLVATEAAARAGLYARISIEDFLMQGDYWRLVTPIFLHFGWAHIIFNMLWLWELGRRIERAVGSLHLLMVVMFVGIASNLWQAYSTPLADFGGMSGVIYGLLAYCGVFYYVAQDKRFALPPAVYVLMLGSLLLGFSGLLDSLVNMANTAHLMGMVYGLVIAVPSALIFRWQGHDTQKS